MCQEVSVSHENDLAVVCRNSTDPLSNTHCGGKQVRLVGGPSNREGRVEVCVGGCWMTACNNNDEGIAKVICEKLGFPRQGKQ